MKQRQQMHKNYTMKKWIKQQIELKNSTKKANLNKTSLLNICHFNSMVQEEQKISVNLNVRSKIWTLEISISISRNILSKSVLRVISLGIQCSFA